MKCDTCGWPWRIENLRELPDLQQAPLRSRGASVYFKRPHRKATWEIDVDDGGFDRAVDPLENGLGEDWDRRSTRTLSARPVWLANQHDLAWSAAHAVQQETSLIDVIMLELIDDVRLQLRVDAFPRETLRMFESPVRDRWNARSARAHPRRLIKTSEQGGDNAAIKTRRLDSLRAFFATEPYSGNCSHLSELKAYFMSLVGGNMPTELPLFGNACKQIIKDLSVADEEALLSIPA